MRPTKPVRSHLVLFAALGLALAGPVAAQESLEVTAGALNLRSGPGTSHGVAGSLARGEVYAGLERRSGWVRLQVGQRTGWASDGYLRASSLPRSVVTASALNVRSGPGTGHGVLASLARGAQVVVRSSSGSWRRIDLGGRAGWVHADHLASASGSVAPGVTPNPAPPPSTNRPRSSAGFIQLAASGPGFYCYSPASRRWGTPAMIYGIERLAARWANERRTPRIGIGDVSAAAGGRISGHASHQRGVDVDVRPIRRDGVEGPSTIHQAVYDRAGTQRAIDLFYAEVRVTHVFFNDSRVRRVQRWPNHDNHFHVRIR